MPKTTATLATTGVALLAAFGAADADAAPPAYNWTGFYVGINGGYGWGHGSFEGDKIKTNGWLAGLHGGYNWAFSGVVVGPELDIGLSGVRGKDPFFEDKDIHLHQRWAGSARLRVGLPVDGIAGGNGLLFYGTGGLAVSGWRAKIDEEGSDSHTHFGWTAGGGIEMSLGTNLTGRVEYLYSDYGSKKYFDGAKIDFKQSAIRFGITYRFAPPPPP